MRFYRQADPAPAIWNVIKTLVSTAAVSLLMFRTVPVFIVRWQEQHQSLDWLLFPPQKWVGAVMVAVGAVPFFWAALTLAIRGRGTPLPFDAPRQLVVTGPYARIRNPMISAGMVQGIGAGFWLGSTLVLGLFVALGFLWNFVVRPEDEHRLERVFGRTYLFYRRSVRCWLPMRRRWDPPEVTAPISINEISTEPKRRRR